MSEPSRTGDDWRCRKCGATKWVAASLNGGITRIRQCVPCGYYSSDRVVSEPSRTGGSEQDYINDQADLMGPGILPPTFDPRPAASRTGDTRTEAAEVIVSELFGYPCEAPHTSASLDTIDCGVCSQCTRDWTPEATAILAAADAVDPMRALAKHLTDLCDGAEAMPDHLPMISTASVRKLLAADAADREADVIRVNADSLTRALQSVSIGGHVHLWDPELPGALLAALGEATE